MLVLGIELALSAAIVAVLARAALPLFSPLPVPDPPAVAPTQGGAESGLLNPFRTSESGSAPSTPVAVETQLDLTLRGTWVETAGASAIIQLPDGKQKTFAIGDEICCGANLVAVYPDQVLIERAGVRESLRLPKSTAPATLADQGAPAAPSEFAEAFRIEPSGEDGVLQFRLFPAGDGKAFEAAGFQSGDLLIAIDEQPAPPDLPGLIELISDLQGRESAQLTVERDGMQMPIEIDLRNLRMGALR